MMGMENIGFRGVFRVESLRFRLDDYNIELRSEYSMIEALEVLLSWGNHWIRYLDPALSAR